MGAAVPAAVKEGDFFGSGGTGTITMTLPAGITNIRP
jgi:hypothetical protein